ncbi:MAG: hypothetical protein BEU04_01325 [Marine Group III euryarchaeote CG-Bathy1]|uniref:Uncharacterized protein n=1 Tax=Marine Group III euryarchaeote CG-Bathy1 TaxID=1889001 RepID=A0A1J5T6W1_9ARCH|nr:MAG: hypothetical protein BEU04_01325 [Marine Group III euryarchaeote CG-Bathy1]
MITNELSMSGCRLVILSTIRGLVSESKDVESKVENFSPDVIALGISPGELKDLSNWDGEPFDISSMQEIHGLFLYDLVGEDQVRLPPPSFVTAINLGIKTESLDMDEEDFTETFNKISAWQQFKYSRLHQKLRKGGLTATTPESFIMELDEQICSISGYENLEKSRELHMSERLRTICTTNSRVLAIIDFPRVSGLLKALE